VADAEQRHLQGAIMTHVPRRVAHGGRRMNLSLAAFIMLETHSRGAPREWWTA
jgi:hypothetical protein